MAETFIALGLAGFAGLVKYLQRFSADPSPPWEWRQFAVHVVTGSFVGLLTLWIAPSDWKTGWLRFSIAMAGYGGPLTLDFFWTALKDAAARYANGAKDR